MSEEGLTERAASRWGVAGHHRTVGLLERAITGGRVSHAYLFAGPRQVGKTTLAVSFARALNCRETNRPCGDCRDCRHIERGVHPDVRVLRFVAGSGATGRRTKNISIEDVRSMLRDVVLAPYEGQWKVYIIRYAEDLSMEGMQALLKTLEEPPAHVVLTLTTADANILPPTVISRCQRINLGLVAATEIERALRERGADPEQAQLLAHHAAGRIGWAIAALANPAVAAARAERVQGIVDVLRAGRNERIVYAEQLAGLFGRDAEATMDVLALWLTWWRDVLLAKNGAVERAVNYERRQELRVFAERYDTSQVVTAMRAIKTARQQLEQNANPRLSLEVLGLSFPVGVV